MDDVSERFQRIQTLGLGLNKEMPVSIWLSGKGEIWIERHGNQGIMGVHGPGKRITQEQVIKLIQIAIDYGDRMISV